VSESGQRICALAEEAAAASDPEAALETLTRIREELAEFERQQVARALTGGRSYGDVARAMGITRQAAHRRFKDLATQKRRASKRLPPTPEVRLVFDYARAEARALGASVLAPVHVLLGILRNGDRRAAAALTASGLSLEDARRVARDDLAASGNGGAGKVDIREMLAETAQCARRRGADRVEVEHLLRSALTSDDRAADRLLGRLGVAPDRVLAELEAAPRDGADCAGA
jgi:ATP-dependent Clp protease ATP-binding subunit ClpA